MGKISLNQSPLYNSFYKKMGTNLNTPLWLISPFCLLLLMIATGPLLYEKFWHKNYPKIAVGMAVKIVVYYLLVLKNFSYPLDALMEYLQFIALVSALYVASGGIYIEVQAAYRPWVNVIFLVLAAVLANFIGTTGASMLLIRPYIRMNRAHIRMYHVVFFIFMVSNIGGALTPIGDPPLFLGFMHGVPFFWTLVHNFLPWLTAMSGLSIIFFFLELKNYRALGTTSNHTDSACQCTVVGKKNFIWLALIISSVFLDPNIFHWLPVLRLGHHEFSFVREITLFSIAFMSYKKADKIALEKNSFDMEPLKEVVLLFIGIFFTMMPAIQIICDFAASPQGQALITRNTLYWGTGSFSAVLDNAPTYLNFLAASIGAHEMDIKTLDHVIAFANGQHTLESTLHLRAISIAAVFFGAMTYIGNGPNLMVKSIADQSGVAMPSFFGYIFRYSLLYLLPVLAIVWVLFVR